MSEQPKIVELRLGTVTQAVRVIAAAPPKLATRVYLGLALAFEDVGNDPMAEMLSIKLSLSAGTVSSAIGSLSKASVSKVGSVASSVNRVVVTKVQQASTPEAKAARVAMVNAIPGFAGAKEFITKATSEARDTWTAAGTVAIEVETEDSDVPSIADAVDTATTALVDPEDRAITPDLVQSI